MPSFSYTKIKWPAEYHKTRLPKWLSKRQRTLCDKAEWVKISSDGTVVETLDKDGIRYCLVDGGTY